MCGMSWVVALKCWLSFFLSSIDFDIVGEIFGDENTIVSKFLSLPCQSSWMLMARQKGSIVLHRLSSISGLAKTKSPPLGRVSITTTLHQPSRCPQPIGTPGSESTFRVTSSFLILPFLRKTLSLLSSPDTDQT